MHRGNYLLLIVVFLLTVQPLAFSQSNGGSTDKAPVIRPNHYPKTFLLKIKPEYKYLCLENTINIDAINSLFSSIGTKTVKKRFSGLSYLKSPRAHVDLTTIYEIEYVGDKDLLAILTYLKTLDYVEYAEPWYYYEPTTYSPNDPGADTTSPTGYQELYLNPIKAYHAWEIEKGDTNITIGILDTGFDLNNPEFTTKVQYNYNDPIDGFDNDGDGFTDNYAGWDMADMDPDVTPSNYHGIEVSGVAVAKPDNNNDIAGVGFNCKFLPVKIFPTAVGGRFRGFESIVYAADKGCQVISLSWGSPGAPSAYEQDVINYATFDRNALVIAAAGNTPMELDFYPAAYDNVLSVAATRYDYTKAGFSTYARSVDICAPGRLIYTTSGNNSLRGVSGTSLATPIIAGTAALVKSKYPTLTAEQLLHQVRITADNVDTVAYNAPYIEKIGTGRVNVLRALTVTNLPAVRAFNKNVVSKFGPDIRGGDTITFDALFKNFLYPTTNLTATLSTNDPYVTIINNVINLGTINTLSSKDNNNNPYVMYIDPSAPIEHVIEFKITYQDGAYYDYEYFEKKLGSDYINIEVNEVSTTATSNGRVGFNNQYKTEGLGFKYAGKQLLYECGLIVGVNDSTISSSVRGDFYSMDNEFSAVKYIRYKENNPDYIDVYSKLQDTTGQKVFITLADSTGGNDPEEKNAPIITSQAYAWQGAPNNKFVVFEYKVHNPNDKNIENLHLGLFADWNIENPFMNRADWDGANNLGYVYNSATNLHAGIKILTPGEISYFAIDNIHIGGNNINIADGFSRKEKYKAISAGIAREKAGNFSMGNDVSHVISTNVPLLLPGESVIVAFALIAGDDLNDLQNSAVNAQSLFEDLYRAAPPVVNNYEVCKGDTTQIIPSGGTTYNFYKESTNNLVGNGAVHEVTNIQQSGLYYVTNADSIFESNPVPVTINVVMPTTDFDINAFDNTIDLMNTNSISVTNNSTGGLAWDWTINKQLSSNDFSPELTFNETGVYQIGLTTTNYLGCQTKSTEYLVVKYTKPSDLEDFTLYPNPSSGEYVTIRFDGADNSVVEFEMTDILGQIIYSESFHTKNTGTEVRVNTANLNKGTYIVAIKSGNNHIQKKLIID